ncbi:hypothetical protein F2Q70_00011932 [Brassica cretica]|uniref:Uncharacterized protein n=1 Tax=Brassica cretica TaxID=69181 RepID=A0A8S9LUF3_BRACR|nr:hypothetical protein F2Q70_00011932 [Brassica cretica]
MFSDFNYRMLIARKCRSIDTPFKISIDRAVAASLDASSRKLYGQVRSDAQCSDHVWIDEPRRFYGNLQPRIVEYAVVVVPGLPDFLLSACRALCRFTCVVEVVKERDRFVFVLAWTRVLVVRRWWWRSCATAAYVEPSLRPPFIHLQPKTINENRSSVRFDGGCNFD